MCLEKFCVKIKRAKQKSKHLLIPKPALQTVPKWILYIERGPRKSLIYKNGLREFLPREERKCRGEVEIIPSGPLWNLEENLLFLLPKPAHSFTVLPGLSLDT